MDKDHLHNCDLVEQDDHDEIKRRSSDAQWKCKECGHVSYKKEHLCEPVDL
ncbi:MAG: hypothetical protein ACFFED_11580 [Candidatus Thorarchaeota archaeon]